MTHRGDELLDSPDPAAALAAYADDPLGWSNPTNRALSAMVAALIDHVSPERLYIALRRGSLAAEGQS